MKIKKAFTLIELLIVVTIIGILVVMAVWSISSNLAKSRDSKRKSDLDRIKIAFEDYYGDTNEYPPDGILSDCGSQALKPYLANIPCDPRSKQPYCYIFDTDNSGQNYRIYSSLENLNDPISAKLDCSEDPTYCGYETECSTYGSKYNYGVASSNVMVNNENIGSGQVGNTPTPTPTSPIGPLPSTNPGLFACTPLGVCDTYANPSGSGCPLTFNDENQCIGYCLTSPSHARCAL